MSPGGSLAYNPRHANITCVLIVLVLRRRRRLVFRRALPGPVIEIAQPAKAIGQTRRAGRQCRLTRRDNSPNWRSRLEQNGKRTPLFSLPGDNSAKLTQESDRRIRLTRPIGKRAVPD